MKGPITMNMSLTRAKAVAKSPESFSDAELDDALTTIVDSPDLTEAQVTRLQASIDPVMRARVEAKKLLGDQQEPVGSQFVPWIQSVKPERERLIWCEECHYWHRTVNECAYVTKAGA